jgi:hypothetical protein
MHLSQNSKYPTTWKIQGVNFAIKGKIRLECHILIKAMDCCEPVSSLTAGELKLEDVIGAILRA